MPKLKINDIEIEVTAGTSILQAAEQLGIEVPRFCYHDKLSVPANCRMCLVEVKPGPPKPQASCALACADGMEVKTDSDMVKKARHGVMEMQLINHPLDCPICDQGGECDLQDQAYAYGFDRSRFYENKSAVKDKDLGPLVKTVMTRCINCTRCVRFAEEIAGTPVLGQLNRGEDAEIGTFIAQAVNSELSGNLIDVCPVGALTSKPYAFTARPWELRKTETIDVMDAVGSNIRVDARGREVMRILPRLNEDINEEWIGDRTRFAYDGLKHKRLDRPWLRGADGKLHEASWDEAFAAIAAKLSTAPIKRTLALAGDLVDLESMVALKDLLGASANYGCRLDGARFDVSRRGNYLFNSGIAGIEEADAIVLVGTDPRHEATMVNARIRKTWLAKRVKVGVIGQAVDLTYPYTHLGTSPQDFTAIEKFITGAQKPILIAGMDAFRRDDGLEVHDALLTLCAKHNMAFNMLHNAAGRVGALDIGFYNQGGFDIGDMAFVWLLGVDEFDMAALPAKAFVVYQGHHGDKGAARADVILPACAYTEKDGLYVNTEGRVQMAKKAVDAPGDAREDWRILRALSAVIGRPLPYDDLYALRTRIFNEYPHLARIDILPKETVQPFGAGGKPSSAPFMLENHSYYLTNPICRASETMQECAKAFGGCVENHGCNKKEAA